MEPAVLLLPLLPGFEPTWQLFTIPGSLFHVLSRLAGTQRTIRVQA